MKVFPKKIAEFSADELDGKIGKMIFQEYDKDVLLAEGVAYSCLAFKEYETNNLYILQEFAIYDDMIPSDEEGDL